MTEYKRRVPGRWHRGKRLQRFELAAESGAETTHLVGVDARTDEPYTADDIEFTFLRELK